MFGDSSFKAVQLKNVQCQPHTAFSVNSCANVLVLISKLPAADKICQWWLFISAASFCLFMSEIKEPLFKRLRNKPSPPWSSSFLTWSVMVGPDLYSQCCTQWVFTARARVQVAGEEEKHGEKRQPQKKPITTRQMGIPTWISHSTQLCVVLCLFLKAAAVSLGHQFYLTVWRRGVVWGAPFR